MYPVIFFDALRVKIRDDAVVRNKAVYLALGVLPDGTRDVLGMWIEQTEGAKFWLKVFNELKTRGVNDILIAVVDGLKGLAEAIEVAFPADHGADLHRAPDPQQPRVRELEGPQGGGRGTAADLRRGQRRGRSSGPGGVRGRTLGSQVPDDRAVLATRLGARDPVLRLPAGSAPRDLHDQRDREPAHAAAQDHQDPRVTSRATRPPSSCMWLALRNILADKVRSAKEWKAAMNQFAVMYGDRFTGVTA